jgi:hypothetical protein
MAKTLTDSRTVTIAQAIPRISVALKAKLPVFLWAGAGVGKSSIVKQLAESMGGISVDLRMANYQPTDISGIPFFNKAGNDGNGDMSFAQPSKLPTQALADKYPIILLFLDELNSAPPATQAAAYQLVLDRKVEQYNLPDNVVIVAAGNRETDRGVTYRMPAPLSNRFVHLEVAVDFQSWFDWATTLGDVHPDVVSFISFSKDSLSDFDAKSSSRAFASPRSWEFVSRILNANTSGDESILSDLVAGTVGEGTAAKFMGYRKIGMSLPKPSEILSGQVKALKNKDISAQYSIIVSLCYEMRDNWHSESTADGTTDNNDRQKRKWKSSKVEDAWMKQADNFLEFTMANFDTEIAIMAARLSLKNYALPFNVAKLTSFKKFAAAYGQFITESSQNR